MGHKLSEAFCLAGTVLIGLFVITCLYIDTITGDDQDIRSVFNKEVDLGYLIERKLIDNQVKIRKLIVEIEKTKKEDVVLLRAVLESNGVHLKENEGCDYDLEKKRFMFYDINKP